ncbi:co-chaperone GroES [Solitalea lacus]|uniref:co-chaperone GroES n=1 Tax=Solitalea lacus TaxID=2911172 RepID=UPI001ED9EB09|nr:co-chaperone GroES family protein [Solitalea lacus]UKJ06036.1 co-chaperone GroES family protein [Solitalea lacus]
MKLTPDNKFKKLIVVGDRILIKPIKPSDRTASGLVLPPGIQEKDKVQRGYVIKSGPGFPLPLPSDEEDYWKNPEEKVKYIPLQAKEGDLAIFLQSNSIEVIYDDEKFFIVPQSAILMLEREESF